MLTALLLAAGLGLTASAQNSFTPGQWLETGATDKLLGYRPLSAPLAETPPAALKKAPANLSLPRYGTFKTGPDQSPVTHAIAVDFSTNNLPARLFVDADGSGDLANVTPVSWTTKNYDRPDGTVMATAFADVTVNLTADGSRRGHLEFYAILGDVTQPQPVAKTIFYHTDCGVAGEFKIDGQTYAGLVGDDQGLGGFATGDSHHYPPLMWIDLNHNGKSDRGETAMVGRPFQVGDQWWAATNLTAAGAFDLVPSHKPVAPKPLVDLTPGHKAPAFTGKLLGGGEVNFPAEYKGKVVLLDFWATWCGPCVGEIPNVVKAYGQYHDRGLEVLGVTLDQENAETKLADFQKKKGMTWRQVYDGKGWSAAVAKQYGINAIPHMILVDGDTGVILADTDIRGEALAPAIEKALTGKGK